MASLSASPCCFAWIRRSGVKVAFACRARVWLKMPNAPKRSKFGAHTWTFDISPLGVAFGCVGIDSFPTLRAVNFLQNAVFVKCSGSARTFSRLGRLLDKTLTVLERWAFLASYETGWRQFSAHGQSLGLEPLGAHP